MRTITLLNNIFICLVLVFASIPPKIVYAEDSGDPLVNALVKMAEYTYCTKQHLCSNLKTDYDSGVKHLGYSVKERNCKKE